VCEAWSLTLGEEHALRMFENMLLRIIFGPKRDENIGGWNKLHNEDLLFIKYMVIRMIKSMRMR
jgi:hypothetical protein